MNELINFFQVDSVLEFSIELISLLALLFIACMGCRYYSYSLLQLSLALLVTSQCLEVASEFSLWESNQLEEYLHFIRDLLSLFGLVLFAISVKYITYLAHVKGEDTERQKIAQELHDDISQRMCLLHMSFGRLSTFKVDESSNKKTFESQIETCEKQLQFISKALHNLSHNLNSEYLHKTSLNESIAQLVYQYEPYLPIEQWHFGGDLNVENVQVKMTVLRFIQEGLNNTLRHSDATTAKIISHRYNNRWKICLADNGHGMKLTNAQMGIGLSNLKQRSMSIGANFSYQSRMGVGFALTLSFDT